MSLELVSFRWITSALAFLAALCIPHELSEWRSSNDGGLETSKFAPEEFVNQQMKGSVALQESCRDMGFVNLGARLYPLLVVGNEAALRVGLSLRGCLDGGELLDFYRGASEFLDLMPALFFQVVSESVVSKQDFGAMVVATPERMIDHLDEAKQLLVARTELVRNLRGEHIQFLKDQATADLASRIHQIDMLNQRN